MSSNFVPVFMQHSTTLRSVLKQRPKWVLKEGRWEQQKFYCAGNPIVHEDGELVRKPWSAHTSSLSSRCPFFLDEKLATPTMDHRAARLDEATAVWAACHACSKTTRAKHPCYVSDLLPADRMWLDVTSGRQMVEAFPARQYLGRYRS